MFVCDINLISVLFCTSDPSQSLVFGPGQAVSYNWERMSEQRWDPGTYPDMLPSISSSASVHSGRRNHMATANHGDLRTGDVPFHVTSDLYNVHNLPPTHFISSFVDVARARFPSCCLGSNLF